MTWIIVIEIKSFIDENGNVKTAPVPIMQLAGIVRTSQDAKTRATELHNLGYHVVVIGPISIDFEI